MPCDANLPVQPRSDVAGLGMVSLRLARFATNTNRRPNMFDKFFWLEVIYWCICGIFYLAISVPICIGIGKLLKELTTGPVDPNDKR